MEGGSDGKPGNFLTGKGCKEAVKARSHNILIAYSCSASACLYAAASACGNKNIYKDNCIIYSAGAAEMVQSIVGISHIEARWRDLEENEGAAETRLCVSWGRAKSPHLVH